MLNEQGLVAECTGDNIFVVKNGAIHDASDLFGRACG